MKDYNLNKDAKNYQDLPFCSEDVVDVRPIVKNIEVNNEDVKYYMEGAEKLMNEQKYEESLELLQTCL